ncbi:MAG: methyltransferase domain-containing protein [Pseudomonadota bacterium]
MRTDVLDLHDFYAGALGALTRSFVAARLSEAWGAAPGLSIAGFGYANPYLDLFTEARSRLVLSPGGQGVIRWPADGRNSASLVGERRWPLPDACLDRVLIVHGLEESPDPRQLLREAWRVLTPDGRIIIVVSHRRGLWSMVEATPFGHGRPYLKRQLNGLLQDALYRATAWSSALYFPPLGAKVLLRAARAWERAGARVWPGLGGVLLVEAAKDLMAPAGLVRSKASRALRPVVVSPKPASLTGLKREG